MVDNAILKSIRKLIKTWAPGWTIKVEDTSTETQNAIKIKLMLYDESLDHRKGLAFNFTGDAINQLAAGRYLWYDDELEKQWLNIPSYCYEQKLQFERDCEIKRSQNGVDNS